MSNKQPFLVIDGYNLLLAVGLIRAGIGPGTLRRARQALLGRLARWMDAAQRERTTIVFDAKSAPDLPESSQLFYGIQVRFATEYEEADDLIELIIREHSSPKQLMVVSSDRRLKRAARRRKSRAIDSLEWFEQLEATVRNRAEAAGPSVSPSKKPTPTPNTGTGMPAKHTSLDPAETTQWLEAFELTTAESLEEVVGTGEVDAPPNDSQASDGEFGADKDGRENTERASDQIAGRDLASGFDSGYGPFPAGYAEDLLKERDESESDDDIFGS